MLDAALEWQERGAALLPLELRGKRPHFELLRVVHGEPTWEYDRLFYDAGLINPVAVPMPSLPSGASRETRRVADGFKLLLGLRWIHDPDEAAPFTWPFISAWCGVTQKAARRALGELLRLGVVVKEDQIAVGNRKMNLYNVGVGRRP